MSLSDILTPRQLEIAQFIARGLTKKEIAAELGVAWAVWSDEAEGVTMSDPTENKPTERGWQVREGAVHWVPEALPAGEQAWTDYREDDCTLRRQKPCDGSQPVRVGHPIFSGNRVRVQAREGGWEAVTE